MDHIHLCLYLFAVGSYLFLKRDPFQGCSGRCVWIVRTLDEDDPVVVQDRVVLVVLHWVSPVAEINVSAP